MDLMTLVCHIFLSCLPTHVQGSLSTCHHTTLEQLTKEADLAFDLPCHGDPSTVEEEIAEEIQMSAGFLAFPPSISNQLLASLHPRTPSEFGLSARNCHPPCSWDLRNAAALSWHHQTRWGHLRLVCLRWWKTRQVDAFCWVLSPRCQCSPPLLCPKRPTQVPLRPPSRLRTDPEFTPLDALFLPSPLDSTSSPLHYSSLMCSTSC